jgi:hypothetical protein
MLYFIPHRLRTSVSEAREQVEMLEEGRGESPAWRHSGDESRPENTKAGNP